MVNIIKQEIVIEESLKKKLELICEFSNTTLKIINGSIRKIDRTNLTYVEPHRIIINDITFLTFNYSNEIFIENLCNKMKLSDLEDNKKSISKEITNLNKNKENITDEIHKKKKLNNKIIIKPKNQLLDDNKKLQEENEHLKSMNYQYKTRYNDLKEKNDYLIYHLNKIIKKLPEFIQNIIDRLFNQCNIDLKYFKQQYNPEVKEKERKIFESRRISNLFNKKEINKSLKHIKEDMEKSTEEFYSNKKQKDDDLSL